MEPITWSDFEKVHLAVFESTAGKFTGISRAKPLKILQLGKNRSQHRPATMAVYLHTIFTREGIRRGKKEDQCLIDNFIVSIPNRAERRLSW